MSSILEVKNLFKFYQKGNEKLHVLNNINFSLEEGSTASIVGPSGSGKTTLLGLCAGLDAPSEGKVIIKGKEISALSEDKRARVRNELIGFVFQNFQLLPTLTALENVMIPLELKNTPNASKKAMSWLEKVGLGERAKHYPTQLSGGEQQRVALARAFANEPKILFADEPTGNLDGETRDKIEKLLFELNKYSGATLVIVTHDLNLAHKTQKIFQIKNGNVSISDN
ncbi:MAG: ABC transporter ATP-binding protein [Flammeovirgaceae bacterium]